MPLNLDVVLGAWPEATKSEEDWEERAGSVMGRLRRGERGASSAYVRDDDLMSSPLGLSSEDGHNSAAKSEPQARDADEGVPMTMHAADRERERRSLKDLAKLANDLSAPTSASAPSGVMRANVGAARDDDSGIVNLAVAAAAEPHAAAHAGSTPLAAHGLYDVAHQPPPSVPPPSVQYTPTTPSVHPAFAQPHASAAFRQPARSGNGVVIGVVFGSLIALAGAAAGGLFYLKAHAPTAPVAMAPSAPITVAVIDTPPPAPPAQAETKPADAPSDPVTTTAPAAHGKVALATKSSASGRAAKPAADAPVAREPEEKVEKPNNSLADKFAGKEPSAPAATPPAAGGDLGSEMKKVAGADENKDKTPAAHVSGSAAANVPQKPSQGAVTGTLGAALPAARACLGPDDPISRGSVVFGSDGSVQSVTVSGAAAGKPAEACIKAALGKAKLPPFAEATYTANVTIRHN